MHMTDIMEGMMISKYLAANSRETYIRQRRVGKMIKKGQRMLLLLMKLGRDTSAANSPSLTHLKDPNQYISS